MIKKLLAMSAVMFVAGAGVAHAGGGYADDDSVACNSASYAVGDTATCSAQTFEPGASASFTLFSAPVAVGSSNANTAGVATLSFTVPDVDAGSHTLSATGTGSDGESLTVSTTLEVTGAGAGGAADTSSAAGGGLPATGSGSTVPLAQVGIAAIAAGGLAVLLANKRRGAHSGAGRVTADV